MNPIPTERVSADQNREKKKKREKGKRGKGKKKGEISAGCYTFDRRGGGERKKKKEKGSQRSE